MIDALFLISVQHELSMEIGNELDLHNNVKRFLKVCTQRLQLRSCHFYCYKNVKGEPIRVELEQPVPVQHFMSYPKRAKQIKWQHNPSLLELANDTEQLDIVRHQNISGNHWYRFNVPQQGVVIFESVFSFEQDLLQAIKPNLEKLATSCYTSIVHDALNNEVKARKQAEDKVSYQANQDVLTSLYNRRYIKTLLTNAYETASAEQFFGAVLFIDLNKFKPINDLMGHNVGDQILQEMANRLKTLARSGIKIARFGGDEFLLIIPNLGRDRAQGQRRVQDTIKDINIRVNAPIEIANQTYHLTCSTGYVLFPDATVPAEDVIKHADIAMYEAKRGKIKEGLIYQPYMSAKLGQRVSLVKEMKHAIDNNEFYLHYQPQYDHLGHIVGAEALLRWYHPTKGLIPPNDYIQVAEESDLIIPLGEWVLKQACKDIKQLEMQGLPESFRKISINVSPKQLVNSNFKKHVKVALNRSAIDPAHLAFELTENILIESFKETIELIKDLKALGIHCSIDDFGKGYSSLTYLKQLPASLIKIDRSFVSNINHDDNSAAIANMIITLGKSLNMAVLAEGVETEDELTCLKKLGCFKYQGFYFSKPMSFALFSNLIKVATDKKS